MRLLKEFSLFLFGRGGFLTSFGMKGSIQVKRKEAAIRKHHFVNTGHSGANRRFFPHPPKVPVIPSASEESLMN